MCYWRRLWRFFQARKIDSSLTGTMIAMFKQSSAVLSALVLLSLTGCAASPEGSGGDPSEADVVGVEDFAAVEGELALVKDSVDAQGNWKRDKATVEGGACYKKTVGADPTHYELRRYTDATFFFHKLGSAPATGDARPVVCADLDVQQETGKTSVDVERFELDAMLRYRLGRETGSKVSGGDPAAGGNIETTFARGHFIVDPAPDGALRYPGFRGKYLMNVTVGDTYIDSALANFVFTFAWRNAKRNDVFRVAADPVGKFVSADNAGDMLNVRYENLDAHKVSEPNREVIYITSKNSDTDLAGHAIVTCAWELMANGLPGAYTCTGL